MKRKTGSIIFAAVLILLFSLAAARRIMPSQIDDVRAGRLCQEELLQDSSVLMVIPIFENHSIAENQTWCEEILALNKSIGMHGVYHSEKEFLTLRNENYVIQGMEEFNKCFGFYPKIFSAPEIKLSKANKNLISSMNLTIHGLSYYITHRVYHCTDSPKKSFLVNLNVFNKIV
jgi:predicted deacetylase